MKRTRNWQSGMSEQMQILISFALVIAALLGLLWVVQQDAPNATVTVDHSNNHVSVDLHPSPTPPGKVIIVYCPTGYVCTPAKP